MARPARGTIESVPLSDGSLSIRGRFRHKGGRYRVAFGLDVDGWTEARGRRELDDILVQLRAGIPLTEILERYGQVDEDEPDVLTPGMSFHEYASDWLRRRRSGELGDPLSDNTNADYEWRLKKHILPFFARMPVAEIRDVDCQHFRAKLFAEREKLRELIAAGAKPKDRRGNPRKPLANRSIQMQMGLLAQILDDAVEDKLRKDNPARAKRLKVKVPKPNRTFLEIDQLVALLDAARELERDPRSTKRAKLTTAQVAEIRARLATGETQARLGREYRLAAGSMSMLAQGKTYRGENDRVGWRALCATLGYAGPRISEALDLRERNVRLHDPAGARFWIADSKTPTGVRHVEITPALRDELFTHLADKARRGYPIGPDEYLFCTRQGHRPAGRTRTATAAARDTAHAQTYIRVDHAAGDQLRRPVRAKPGRAQRQQDDNGCLCATPRSQQTRSRSCVRRTPQRGAGDPVRIYRPGATRRPPPSQVERRDLVLR